MWLKIINDYRIKFEPVRTKTWPLSSLLLSYILQKIGIRTIGCRKIHVQNIYEILRNGRLDRSNSFTSNKYLADFVKKRTYNQREKI